MTLMARGVKGFGESHPNLPKRKNTYKPIEKEGPSQANKASLLRIFCGKKG